MKRLLAIFLLLCSCIFAKAQNYPLEWEVYTSDAYFHAIESGINEKKLPEERFRNDLLDIARTNLAKQIEVRVNEVSQKSKEVINGNANIYYSSHRNISTNVDLKFAESKSYIDILSGKQYVLVYINKADACRYYENEIKQLISKIDNAVAIAENYIGTGFKSKAKDELNKALVHFDKSGEIFFWLNVFCMPDHQMEQYFEQINQREQTVKSKISDLEYGTSYCVVCNADNFGRKYFKLTNEIKGDLSESGCNFVEDPTSADYVIYIDAAAREYNMTSVSYFTYVDAKIAVDKTATHQRVYENEISIKGCHTIGYKEAAIDGYKKISKEISKMLKENIEL